MTTAVYQIVQRPAGYRYIGQAASIKARWKCHRSDLRAGRHHSRRLQYAWNKHGESAFSFEVLVVCRRDDLTMYEQAAFDAFSPEFNHAPIAGSIRGVKRSAETCEKLRRAGLGRTHTAETRARLSRAALEMSPELRAKINAAMKGRKVSPEGLEKRRKSSCYGRPHSPETRAKISALKRGVPRPAGFGDKMRQINLGRKHTDQTRAKMSAAQMLRPPRPPMSEEARAKMSASAKARCARGVPSNLPSLRNRK